MTPKQNQFVKILFKNGLSAEGFVDVWTEDQIVLKDHASKSVFVVAAVSEIMGYKIALTEIKRSEPEKKKEVLSEELEEIEEEIEKVIELPSKDTSRLKKLADLRTDLAKAEKEVIANQLRTLHIGAPTKVTYGLPGFFKK